MRRATQQGTALSSESRPHVERPPYRQRHSSFPGAFRNLRLFALDPYDLALAKLRRNSQRDREDVLYLSNAVPLDIGTLRAGTMRCGPAWETRSARI
jgi:hypothetical protein